MMNSVVQPPNRLERVNAGPISPSKTDATAPSSPEQASTAKPPVQDPPSAVAAAPPAKVADPKPAPSPQPAASAAPMTDAARDLQGQPAAMTKDPAPVPVAKNDDQAPATSERTTVGRAPDPNREASRKRDDRKFSERRRRHDQDPRRLDEATNVVRQMPRGYTPDEYVERDDTPRFNGRPRHFELFGDDDSPRVINEPPPPPHFGFFGN
jgi:hypothetical protein